jgi:hypothetical protein
MNKEDILQLILKLIKKGNYEISYGLIIRNNISIDDKLLY